MAMVAFSSAAVVFAAARPPAPAFREVFDLVSSNASGIDSAGLNEAAVEGLLARLHHRAWLLDANMVSAPETNSATLASSAVFEDSYGYLRIARVGTGLPEQFKAALASLHATNKLKGLVIDLRFATGQDYAAAGAVADLFIGAEQKLFQWNGGTATSREKTNAFRPPVAVLVNHFTAGAPEVLAAVLRDVEVALLIGTNSAGQASTTRDFPLKNGQILRLATSPVKLANGDIVAGLQPDITVEVSPDDERAYFADAYKILPRPGAASNAPLASLSVTNRGPRRRINEAELVRMSREGTDPEDEAAKAPRAVIPPRPTVTDPALARAIDLLKALAVVRRGRF